MAWMSVATSLVVGGCLAGVATGILYAVGGGSNTSYISASSEMLEEGRKQDKKTQFLEKLSDEEGCSVVEGVKEKGKIFGTIYTCYKAEESYSYDVNSLYYLDEESTLDFDNLDTSKKAISILKKIESFQYKQEGDSFPYLSFNVGNQVKKIFVESSDSDDWSLYKGFSNIENK